MKQFFSLLGLLLPFSFLQAQTDVLDGVYIKASTPARRTDPTFGIDAASGTIRTPGFDTMARRLDQLAAENKWSERQKKAPLKIDNAVYFYPPDWLQPQDAGSKEPGKGRLTRDFNPEALRFSVDTAFLQINPLKEIEYRHIDDDFLRRYLSGFYFSRFEVTNREYKLFVQWVKDSVMRATLGYRLPNGVIDRKKKIDADDSASHAKLSVLYYVFHERYYRRREIDTRKLKYVFDHPSREVADRGKQVLEIYPDTTAWLNDFSFAYNEPLTNMYFWHPAFDDYPVVGITYWQALAYLDWRTMMEQQKLDREGKKMVIRFDLPSEREWECAATSWIGDDQQLQALGGQARHFADRSWLTDLRLHGGDGGMLMMDGKDTVFMIGNDLRAVPRMRADIVTSQRYRGNNTPGDLIFNGGFHTVVSDPGRISARVKKQAYMGRYYPQEKPDMINGIAWMGGNVSEWLKDDFSQWEKLYAWRQRQLQSIGEEDAALQAQIEARSFKYNDKNGKLVRGCNWFDERYGSMAGRNTMGMNAKRFVDPDKAYSTLGFRYVIYVTPK